MPLKPTVIFDVPADIPSMKKTIGPKLAKKYSANPKMAKYAFVLKLPDGVVTGRAVAHALSRISTPRGPDLACGCALYGRSNGDRQDRRL
jgi:hypothetical protein